MLEGQGRIGLPVWVFILEDEHSTRMSLTLLGQSPQATLLAKIKGIPTAAIVAQTRWIFPWLRSEDWTRNRVFSEELCALAAKFCKTALLPCKCINM